MSRMIPSFEMIRFGRWLSALVAWALLPSLWTQAAEKPVLLPKDTGSFSSTLPLVVLQTAGEEIKHDAKTPASARVINNRQGRNVLSGSAEFEGSVLLNIRGHSSLRYPKHSYSLKLVDKVHDAHKASLLGMPKESDWVLYGPYPDKTLMRDFLAYELSNAMGRWAPHGRFVEVFVNESKTEISMSHYMGVYVLEEKVTRGKDRVDIAKLDASASREPEISGGYIFKKDHTSRSQRKRFGEDGPPQAGQVNDRAGYPTPPGGFPADPAGFLPPYGKPSKATGKNNAPGPSRPKKKGKFTEVTLAKTNYIPAAVPQSVKMDDATVLSDEEVFRTREKDNEFYYAEPESDEITPVQRAWLKRYVNDAESAIYGPNFTDPAKGYRAWIEPDSFIDHHLLVEITKNVDGFRFSTFYYKDRKGRLNMGPAWDWNLSFGNASGKKGYMPEHWLWPQLDDQQYTWFRRLFEDADFGQRYVDRWAQLRTNIFATARILARVDQLASELKEAQARNFAKWEILGEDISPNYFVGATYQEEIEWMKDWISKRLAWIDAQFVPVPTVKSGDSVTLETTAVDGKIFYTLDGSDPRAAGGEVGPTATLYAKPFGRATGAKVRARVQVGTRWSGPLVW